MTSPVILITGQADWIEPFIQQLSDTYQIIQQRDDSGYMNTLIDQRAALVLVSDDGDDPYRWIRAPKVSPATRRIPILFISADEIHNREARLHGADRTLSPDALLGDAAGIVQEIARLTDDDERQQLLDDCQQALPPRAQEAIRLFNAGEFYQQHDLFEEQWVETEGAIRDLYRAILQVGVAYFQIQRGNYRGALKMLQRSVQWLVVLPDVCQGVDIKQLRDDSAAVRAELERIGEDRIQEFDQTLLKPVIWSGNDE